MGMACGMDGEEGIYMADFMWKRERKSSFGRTRLRWVYLFNYSLHGADSFLRS
jgi:hypothetical protein